MSYLKFRVWSKKHNSYLKITGTQYDDEKLAGIFVLYGTIAGIPNTIRLEPEDVILEQYTGLKDKNGKEIYENDILEDGSGEPLEYWVVRFEDGKFIGEIQGVVEDLFELTDLEIIGNFHENSELLKGK